MLENNRLSIYRSTLGILLTFLAFYIAIYVAIYSARFLVNLGAPVFVTRIVASVLYPLLTFLCVKLICQKILKVPLKEFNIIRFNLKWYWVLSAVIMPLLVLLISLLTGGYWEVNVLDNNTIFVTIVTSIFFSGFATGIVEEMVFRGVIQGCLSRHLGKNLAIVITSVFFASIHIIGRSLSPLSIVQLIIAGTAVGILFSLIELESGSFWNNATVHAIWNIIIFADILNIGLTPNGSAIFNYILGSDAFLITGGDFGIEVSIISIGVYILFSIFAISMIRKRKIQAD